MLRWNRVLIVLMMAVVLTACGNDPIVEDLARFDSISTAAMLGLSPAGMNKKLLAAETDEERAAALDYFATGLEKHTQSFSGFTPRSAEVKALREAAINGFKQSAAGAREAQQAFANKDFAALQGASQKMSDGQTAVLQMGRNFVRLAREKGYSPGE